jgi:hypothetical protein
MRAELRDRAVALPAPRHLLLRRHSRTLAQVDALPPGDRSLYHPCQIIKIASRALAVDHLALHG